MSYANFGPSLNSVSTFSLVDANPVDVPVAVNAANQLNVFLCRDAGGINEITLPLAAGVYSVSISATLEIPATAGAVGLQNLQVNCTNTANVLLVSSVFAQTSATASASTVLLTGSAVVVIPVATSLKLRMNYLNIVAGFAPTIGTGGLSRIQAVRLFSA
jgi:hypothetical protein